ncbi:MAG TPA: FAD-dependent oxidoreductase [Puia sp.]|nr:FAD-dependent oxidoreductase [Puia sp.]
MIWRILIFCLIFSRAGAQSYDICIYGGTSAGVIAAYTASKMHKTVILIEPGFHLGGLSSGGLGYTDIGNKYAIGGLSLDFYRRVGLYYGVLEQWVFEPHVAEGVYGQYVKEGKLNVLYGWRITAATKDGAMIRSIHLESHATDDAASAATSGLAAPTTSGTAGTAASGAAKEIRAKMFIDCSYEGDLMAKAGVSYTVGREANSLYGETYDGVQLRDKHQFPDGIDPYKTPKDPSSGLLWGVSSQPPGERGAGDKKVQSYNYRICLTNDPANRIPITRPERYDPAKYELLLRYIAIKTPGDLWGFLKFDLLPNHKTDINNNGPFSTDMIGMNYDYPEGDYATRKAIIQAHIDYTKGFLYFIGHDPRMPERLRQLMLQWGYPKDEYADNGNWTPQLYVREARRMVGSYVMTQANCEGREKVEDGIGLAAYTMDSHNCQRVAVNGMVKNEGDVQIGGFPPYPISYRSIIPKKEDCRNLLVPVCLSASHIAYGSIRMEPVFMELGQSASIAAGLAIDRGLSIQEVDAAGIRQILKANPLADGSTPEILLDNDDTAHVVVKGGWIRQQQDAYGFSRLADTASGRTDTPAGRADTAAGRAVAAANGSSASELKTVRFLPEVIKAGEYSLYIYVPRIKNGTTFTTVTISGLKELRVKTGGLSIEGQTTGQWVEAGKVSLKKGTDNYIEISNKGADGAVVADAVLLVPKR